MFGYRDLFWRGDALYRDGSKAALAHVVPDERYPGMWRAKVTSGTFSDMTNKTRAKDAAMEAALAVLNRKQEYRKQPSEAPRTVSAEVAA
jgi:hypothetical protein